MSAGAQSAFAAGTSACPENLDATATSVVGDTCFAYYEAQQNWYNAKTLCDIHRGHLVVVRNEKTNAAVQSLITGDVWLGASDESANISLASEGNFFWLSDATPFWKGVQKGSSVRRAYANWNTNEPNNFGGNKNCVTIHAADGRWNTSACSAKYGYVCQIAATKMSGRLEKNPDPQAPRTSTRQKRMERLAVARTNTSDVASSSSTSSASSSLAPTLTPDQRMVATLHLKLHLDSQIDSKVLVMLSQGQVLTLLGIAHGDWAHVQLPDGTVGYVWRKHLSK